VKRTTYFCDRCASEFRRINELELRKASLTPRKLDLCDTCLEIFDKQINSFLIEGQPKLGEVDSVTEGFFKQGKVIDALSVTN